MAVFFLSPAKGYRFLALSLGCFKAPLWKTHRLLSVISCFILFHCDHILLSAMTCAHYHGQWGCTGVYIYVLAGRSVISSKLVHLKYSQSIQYVQVWGNLESVNFLYSEI